MSQQPYDRFADELAVISGLEREVAATWRRLGVKIYTMRQHAGLTLREAASRANVDHGHLHHVEKGTKTMSGASLARVLRVINDELDNRQAYEWENPINLQPVWKKGTLADAVDFARHVQQPITVYQFESEVCTIVPPETTSAPGDETEGA